LKVSGLMSPLGGLARVMTLVEGMVVLESVDTMYRCSAAECWTQYMEMAKSEV
jgi:hypothetical protein